MAQDSTDTLTIGEDRTANGRIIDDCQILTEEMARLYSSDVFEAFQMDNEYPTQLQREQYRKSAEFKARDAYLKKIQTEFESRTFCLLGSGLGDYDTKRRGFVYKTSDTNIASEEYQKTNVLWGPDTAVSVPGVKKVFYPNPYQWHFELFLPVPSDIALEIEKDRAELYLVVRLTGIKRHHEIVPGIRHSTQHILLGKFLKFMIANAEEGKIY